MKENWNFSIAVLSFLKTKGTFHVPIAQRMPCSLTNISLSNNGGFMYGLTYHRGYLLLQKSFQTLSSLTFTLIKQHICPKKGQKSMSPAQGWQ